MEGKLKGKRIAVLATDGFEELEFTKPIERLKKEGAEVEVVSLKTGEIKAWAKTDWGDKYKVDTTVEEAESEDYDGLVLPGGVMNPDRLRADALAVNFVAGFIDANKPVAAICHGPWTLIETGYVKGKTLTSYQSIQTDLKNAGAHWVDEEVVIDGNLVTSRKPEDLPTFCDKMIEVFSK